MQLVLRDGESGCLLRGQRVGRGDVGHRAHGNVRHPGGPLQHGAGLPPPGQGQKQVAMRGGGVQIGQGSSQDYLNDCNFVFELRRNKSLHYFFESLVQLESS